jgi:hypothetical protein
MEHSCAQRNTQTKAAQQVRNKKVQSMPSFEKYLVIFFFACGGLLQGCFGQTFQIS